MGGELISRNSRKQVIPGPLGPLAAVIDAPRDRPPRAWALLCHGFGSFKEFKPLAKIAQGLIERGWGALRFDFAGLGASGGEFAESSFHTQQDDVRSVHGWMRESGMAPRLLVGHSLGGATLLSLGAELPARQLATIGAPSDTVHLAHALERMQPQLRSGEADVEIAGKRRRITPRMLRVLRESDFSDALARLPQQLLVIQPGDDEMVAAQHGQRIVSLAGQPDALWTVHGADHLLSEPAHLRLVVERVAAWADDDVHDDDVHDDDVHNDVRPSTNVRRTSSPSMLDQHSE